MNAIAEKMTQFQDKISTLDMLMKKRQDAGETKENASRTAERSRSANKSILT